MDVSLHKRGVRRAYSFKFTDIRTTWAQGKGTNEEKELPRKRVTETKQRHGHRFIFFPKGGRGSCAENKRSSSFRIIRGSDVEIACFLRGLKKITNAANEERGSWEV